jgi:transportin-3
MIVQAEIFRCLSSWLIAGEIDASSLASTPLLGYAFEALASDDLFDVAVNVVCDTIHETQEVDDNREVIGMIMPQVIALEPLLTTWTEDSDKIRGLARIFAEAGETYRGLILHHPETFFPLVKAIGHCSAHPDLDVVPITFPFWMRLAQSIGKKPSVSPLFHEAYQSLMNIIVQHLHFPATAISQTSQEAENFRHFRHIMGDTLKDCCVVLGTDACLMTAYGLVTNALSRDPAMLSWQEVEAPLFSMRSMGAEVDTDDEKVVPKIMDLVPNLPNHPRIQYATLLLIARYTEWTNKHPDYLPQQLQYVSAGFDSPEEDVQMAAGQALKYLCQDCKMVRLPIIEFCGQLIPPFIASRDVPSPASHLRLLQGT